jgi:hypothetical protein
MAIDRKFLKQRISIGFKGLSRLGKMFTKKGRSGSEPSADRTYSRGGGR